MYEDIKTACLYVRFSSHNQTEQSIEGQTRVCRDFCKRHNIRIVEIYADRATSASKDIEKRVQFLKMIKDSEKGLFDAVIVYKLDRFARSRYDSATYKYRLKRNGVQLISATENISNDPEGIILESVLEGMAEFYSAELSQKINRGMRESAYKHNSIGGAVPLGYKIEDKKLVIDPKTAPLVKEAFEKYADGETVAEICRQFNARGYKTSKGTAFGKSSFTKIFRNERYIGVYSFHDYRAEGAVPAIIDKDLWDRVQLRVGKIKNAPARNKAKVVYLLSGKLFCGHCGSRMNGNCNASNYCYYQCYGKKNGHVDCNKKNIRKEFIERLVAQDALSLLTDEYIEQIAAIACEKNQHEIELDSALPTIRDRIHQVDLSLNNLLKAIESGSAPDMLVKRMGELEKEKKDLQAQAKKESEDIVELDKAQVIYWLEQFRGGSIEDEEFCRMLIDLFVNSVTVWDEDDDTYKVTVAYNLTSLPTKTYRLSKGGTLSDFASNAPAKKAAKVSPLAAVSGNANDLEPARNAANTQLLKIDTALGIYHAKANRKNLFLMTSSFALSIILFLSFSVTVEFMQHTLTPLQPWTADLSIISPDNACAIDKALLDDLKENPVVDLAYGRKFAYEVPSVTNGIEKKMDLISYEQYQFDWAKDYLLEGSLESVQTDLGTGLIVYNSQNTIQIGDTVSLNTNGQSKEIQIVGMLSDCPFYSAAGVGTIICSEDTFEQITGESKYTVIDVQLVKGTTDEDVYVIRQMVDSSFTFADERMGNSSTMGTYYCFWLFIYGFLVLIAMITIFNIINSISMSVSARLKQYGAFRAIGVSMGQLSKMIVAEAFTYTIIGGVVGTVLGLFCNKLLFGMLISYRWGDAWTPPLPEVAVILLIVVSSVILAVHGPIKRIRNMSIVDTISAQ